MNATIECHSSVQDRTLVMNAVASLQTNRVDPKLLYVSRKQADLWREVNRQHSPVHGNAEFTRIYRDAFAKVAEKVSANKVWLIGLGSGTGRKEADLCALLQSGQREVFFSAIDVSHDLVNESVQKLVVSGARPRRSLVCDLAETHFLAQWLERDAADFPRLFTFFGLVPNLAPSGVTRLFRAVLRPGDLLLASVHLAPVNESVDLSDAMRRVLPQYHNEETLAWLAAALEQWEVVELLDAPEMIIGEVEGIPAFIGRARWKSNETFERWGQKFASDREKPLQLFHSLRYTPELFEHSLKKDEFSFERLAMTACREEAIWSVRLRL